MLIFVLAKRLIWQANNKGVMYDKAVYAGSGVRCVVCEYRVIYVAGIGGESCCIMGGVIVLCGVIVCIVHTCKGCGLCTCESGDSHRTTKKGV